MPDQNMKSVDFNKLDLGLLVLFEAIAAERNVTRAAHRVGITQPSASKGLDRLRHTFKDPLFVRTARGMRPTDRAMELDGPVKHALSAVRELAERVRPFKPDKAKGIVRIGMSDAAEFVLLPPLIALLAKEAPGVDLRVRPLDKDTAFDQLDDGKLDCLVGVFANLPKRYAKLTLWEERFLCIAKSSRVSAKNQMTLDLYADMPHILVSLRDDTHGFVDDVLAKSGRSRRIAATVGRFMVVPFVIQASDCVATLPSRMALAISKSTQCTVFEPPFHMTPWKETLIWHRATDRSPMLSWFRRLIKRCAPKDVLS